MKQITDAKNVMHLWANQRQNELTEAQKRKNGNGFNTPSKNVFSVGNEIYSYGYHFCMAKIYTITTPNIVFMANRGYSVTTAKHLRYLRDAVSHHEIVYCAYPEITPSVFDTELTDKNFKGFRNTLYELQEKLGKARKPEKYINDLVFELENLRKYILYMGRYIIEHDMPETIAKYERLYKEFNVENLQANAKEVQQKAKADLKTKYLKYENLMTEYWFNYWGNPNTPYNTEEAKAELINKFNSIPHNVRNLWVENHGDLLRIDGELLHTSKGVYVDLEEAKTGFLAWKSGRLNGFKFSGFVVTKSDSRGFIAGCHTIKAQEINRIAKQLNW